MLLTGIARLGRDAELRFTPSGQKVANLALAFNYGQKGADGKRPSQWIEAALWGDRAESLAAYLTKGSAISVTLSDPHIETYTTKDGRNGSKIVGRVIDLEFAGGAKPSTTGAAPASPPTAPTTNATADAGFGEFGDDIPF
jgi:single-strand DNA-binding protein